MTTTGMCQSTYYFSNIYLRKKNFISQIPEDYMVIGVRESNFAPSHFDSSYSAPPYNGFSRPAKVVERDGAIFCSRISRRGEDGFNIFIHALSRPQPALIMTIIVNLVNPKSVIFKVKHKTLDKIFFILNLLLLPLTLLPSL